ncbi:hypothetical protein [Burkholderia pseudomallei]|uniref:hypothetical protein n=1 Tax=Burkholderia pseudomallei TaxID=28450 RepID=UPI0010655FED|nr:hypothetical protein [Burkholderia pseudomallei]QBP71425.1 hypothetical protein E2R25_25575 [Burkholderia pseudomallei]
MKRCPECATSRPYELSDGRYKCRSCGKKFSWTWVWDRVAGLFGAYGDEGVEDVHLVSSLLASLIVAVAVVCGANRLFRRPSRGN